MADLIESECGVRYHRARLAHLRELGWSCQRPVGRALERDERRSGGGSRSAGRELKKSPKTKAHHRLRRRKRTERAPAPNAHLGAAGTDAGAAVPLQLENTLGRGRDHLVEFLLPAVSGSDPCAPNHRIPGAPAAAYSRQAADRLGRVAVPPQPPGAGLRAAAERTPLWSVCRAMLRS